MKDKFSGLIELIVASLANHIDGDAWSVFGTWADKNKENLVDVSEKDIVTYYVTEVNRFMGNQVNMSRFLLTKSAKEYCNLFNEEAVWLFEECDDFSVKDI